MTEILDPEVPGSGQQNPPPEPVGGQSTNWEERFKGQQREFNKLQTKLTATETALQNTKGEFSSFKAEQNTVLSEAVSKETDYAAKIAQMGTELESARARAAEIQEKLAQKESRETQRAALVAAEGGDLIEVFESGDLNIAGLEGDALKAKLTTYRERILKLAEKSFSGATPPNAPINNSPNPSGMNFEQLGDWLMKPENQSKDEYDAFYEQYQAQLPKP